MPELATSVIACLRKEDDVAFGNIVGSNIYNILGIGGLTALLVPGSVPTDVVGFDAYVTIGISTLLMAFAFTGHRLAR